MGIKKKFPSATLVAYTRSSRNASALTKAGLKPLIGTGVTKEDYALIKDVVKTSDVVVDCADCDDLPLAETILSGLAESKTKAPILLHTR